MQCTLNWNVDDTVQHFRYKRFQPHCDQPSKGLVVQKGSFSSRCSYIMDFNVLDPHSSTPSGGIYLKKMTPSTRVASQNRQMQTEFNTATGPSLPSVRKMKDLFHLVLPSSSFPKRTGVNMTDPARPHEHSHTVRTQLSQENSASETSRQLELPPILTLDQQIAKDFLSPGFSMNVDFASSENRAREILASYCALEGKRSPSSSCDSRHTTSSQRSANAANSSPDSCDFLWASDAIAFSSKTSFIHSTTATFYRDAHVYFPSEDEGSSEVRLESPTESLPS